MVGRNKKKHHAVRVGREPGIYNSWDEAEEQVTEFSGAEYCSFRLKKDANKYMKEKPKDQGVAKHQNLEPVDHRDINEKPRDKSSEEDENESFLVVDGFNCNNDFEERLARKDDEIKELWEQLDFLWDLYKKDEERISKMESFLQQNDRFSDTSDLADFFPSTPVMNTSTQTENCSSRYHLDDQTDNIFNCHSATPVSQIELLLTAIKNENIELTDKNKDLLAENESMRTIIYQLREENERLLMERETLMKRNNTLEKTLAAVLEKQEHERN